MILWLPGLMAQTAQDIPQKIRALEQQVQNTSRNKNRSSPFRHYNKSFRSSGPAGLKGSPDNLYHNNGDGTLSDVSKQAGVNDPAGLLGLTAVWSDLNNDGKLELFLANDGASNYLYKNDGAAFTDVGWPGRRGSRRKR